MRRHRASAAALLTAAAVAGCGGSGGGLAKPSKPRTEAEVIRAWADAVRARHYDEATDLFALPAVIDNGGRVRARRRAVVEAFNRSLSCGAVLKRTEAASGKRVEATFKLVRGPGGPCSGTAHVTFRIAHGRITEWIRDDSAPPAGTQQT